MNQCPCSSVAEHPPCKRRVVGSNPTSGSMGSQRIEWDIGAKALAATGAVIAGSSAYAARKSLSERPWRFLRSLA